MSFEGFIVHSFCQTVKNSTRICLIGRLSNGETFVIIEERERPGFYIRESDRNVVSGSQGLKESILEISNMHTMDGEECFRISCKTTRQAEYAKGILENMGVRTYEADIRFYDQFLMSKNIHGSLKISGPFRKGNHVDRIFINPSIQTSNWHPELSILSVDIETNPVTMEILAIGLVFSYPRADERIEEVLFQGRELDEPGVKSFIDEKSLLEAFRERVAVLDPDIITGWNVIDFDFKIIHRRFGHYHIPMKIGRSDEPADYLTGTKVRSGAMIIPGRQIIDALRLVRAGQVRFADHRLETVAKEVLGEGKVRVQNTDEAKIEALMRTYKEDPITFCKYCLRDSNLVLEILEKTGLFDLTLRRTLLIGIGLSRAWTSIAAFDFIYIEAMHKREMAAPTLGVDAPPLGHAPGGAIISPQSGLYDNVLIFDFKSLYPSIIRTFNIDPVSYALALQRESGNTEIDKLIRAPNGAYFIRSPGILPELLNRFFESRDLAKKQGDMVASYMYKIIMNSFYGVLGASGCRFAASELAGAITSFGQHILNWCGDLIIEEGYSVIYGDTDSLFVVSGLRPESSYQDIRKCGEHISSLINSRLSRYVLDTWKLESQLELEFETIYSRFFLPPVRGAVYSDTDKEQIRGRAKGYAGRRLTPDTIEGTEAEVDIKGMEAVRRDWTDIAKSMQVMLLEMVFDRKPISEITGYIKVLIRDLYSGKHDNLLIYRKALRKPVRAYTLSLPPHVKAAKLLDKEDQGGVIEYIWTADGPQPVGRVTAVIDYEHYLRSQLQPIAGTFSDVLGTDIEAIFNRDQQLLLF